WRGGGAGGRARPRGGGRAGGEGGGPGGGAPPPLLKRGPPAVPPPPPPPAVAAAPASSAVPASSAAAATTVLAGLGLVHRQGPAVQLGPVHRGNRLVPAVAHLDEREPPGPAGLAVHDDLDLGHRAVLGERLPELVLGRREGHVADIQVLGHGQSSQAHQYKVEHGRDFILPGSHSAATRFRFRSPPLSSSARPTRPPSPGRPRKQRPSGPRPSPP